MSFTHSLIYFFLLLQPCVAVEKRIITSEIPPMAFTDNNKLTGFCVELIEEIQRRIRDKTKIESIPWMRAYKIGLESKQIILVCPKRTQERENLFKWVGPVVESTTSFFKKKGSPLAIHNIEEAQSVGSILVPRGFYSVQELSGLGFKNLEIVNDSVTGMRMLLAGRASLLALDRSQVPYILTLLKAKPSDIVEAYKVSPAKGYFAFSKDFSDSTIKVWKESLAEVKADGFYEKLHTKWFKH